MDYWFINSIYLTWFHITNTISEKQLTASTHCCTWQRLPFPKSDIHQLTSVIENDSVHTVGFKMVDILCFRFF